MKFNKEEWIQKKRKVPRGTYMIMLFMGFYMFYLLSKVIGGLADPNLSGKVFVYVGIAFLVAAAIAFICLGASALIKKDYREAWPENSDVEMNLEDSNPIEETKVSQKKEIE